MLNLNDNILGLLSIKMSVPALFLDRDGVINVDHSYVHTIKNFEFVDGIFDLARFACSKNYKLIVITNQAGIAKGYFTEKQFHILNNWMIKQFSIACATLSEVYFCPYHPKEGLGKYLKDDYNRKPNPGMILQAQKKFNIDLNCSVLIGDNLTDIQAGNSAGVMTNLLFTKNLNQKPNKLSYEKISSLVEAKQYLMSFCS
jgi:D-glycero-D-manno-heptose 1,7-bisphosphate phosphatase